METPAGWYADPWAPASLRYWDGSAWTEHVAAAPAPSTIAEIGRSSRADVLLAAGAGLVLVGSALPWLGRDGRSVTSWSLPVESLFRGEPTDGPSAGIVLLGVSVLAGVLALLPTLARQTPRPIFSLLAGSAAFDIALMAVMASATVKPGLTLGAGAIVALLGSILISVSTVLARARWRAVSHGVA